MLVGQAPARTTEGLRAFDGPSGDRLATYAGLHSRRDLLAAFDCRNLLQRYPGRSSGEKGDAFPMAEARAAARALARETQGRVVLLAGRNVAAAFGLRTAPWLTWVEHLGARVAVLPHPSGICRWWNEPANRERARDFLGRLLGLPSGQSFRNLQPSAQADTINTRRRGAPNRKNETMETITMSQPTTTTQPLPTSSANAVAASPSARELIEWVYEESAVTAHDTCKMFKLTDDDANRVLLAAGLVVDQGVWSLATEHEDDPDAAVDAWMDKHGPENVDRPLLKLDSLDAPPKVEPKAAPKKKTSSKKKAPPKTAKKETKAKAGGSKKKSTKKAAKKETKGKAEPKPEPKVEPEKVEPEAVPVAVPAVMEKITELQGKIATARAKKKSIPTNAILEEVLTVLASIAGDVHALKQRPASTRRRSSGGGKRAGTLPTVEELKTQSWLQPQDGDDDAVADHLSASLASLTAAVEAGDLDTYRAARKKAYDRAWTLRKRAAKKAGK